MPHTASPNYSSPLKFWPSFAHVSLQVLLHVALHKQELPLSNKALLGLGPFVEKCARHFTEASQRAAPSRLQRSVAAVLRQMNVKFVEEVVLSDAGGYSADILLQKRRVVVEVDGPSHFVQGPGGFAASGATLLKRRQLQCFGYDVVSVPFWEWYGMAKAKRRRYLRGLGLGDTP